MTDCDSTSSLQAERKRTEREPRDWATMREALIASGMVDEARKRREAQTLDDKIAAYPSETWLRQVSSVGELREKRTVIDELFEEDHP